MAPQTFVGSLGTALFLLSLHLAFFGAMAPVNWALRLVAVAAVSQWAILSLEIDNWDKGFGYAIGVWLVTWVWIGALFVFILRQLILSFLSNPAGPPAVPARLDQVFWAVVSSGLVISLARISDGSLAGFTKPVLLHWVLGIGCAVAALLILVRAPFRMKGIAAGALTLSYITYWSATQPDRMLQSAIEVADGAPWCIALPRPVLESSHKSELMLLTAPGNRRCYHATLVIGVPGSARYYWSRGYQTFHQMNDRSGLAFGDCRPSPTFGTPEGRSK